MYVNTKTQVAVQNWIFPSPFAGAPKKGNAKSGYDSCTPYGGSCIKSRELCPGFVDDWAYGCTDREICCHPPPEDQHPEPEHPGKISDIMISRVKHLGFNHESKHPSKTSLAYTPYTRLDKARIPR